jgi:hypothetical protein
MLATQIAAGMKFTDDMGHSHTAVRTEAGVANGRGVYIFVEGQEYPEFYLNETLMFVEAAPAPKRPAAPVMGPQTIQYVIESERRIAYLARYKDSDDMKWRYLKFQDDAGRVTRRTYKTELGFLKAYVRAARAGMDILIAE